MFGVEFNPCNVILTNFFNAPLLYQNGLQVKFPQGSTMRKSAEKLFYSIFERYHGRSIPEIGMIQRGEYIKCQKFYVLDNRRCIFLTF